MTDDAHVDFVIVGSGFGGSVAGLRLVEKGYSVRMLEKGRRFAAADFPKTNWDLPNWLWLPQLGLRGIFKMTFLSRVTVLSGVGVGGGSLVYANTLPVPKEEFYRTGSWAGLSDWQADLAPFYNTAKRMLGATRYPHRHAGDDALSAVAKDMGLAHDIEPTDVAVFLGEPGVTVPDPFFGGEGPERTGCTLCGSCMTGCRHGAKNTLDKNYLYLAERKGLKIHAQTEVTRVRTRPEGGYVVDTEAWPSGEKKSFTADKVVLAGGVLGTVELLLRMKATGDLKLSERVGDFVRTNSEALIGVTTLGTTDCSEGVAITSILHTDAHSHIEPVRYGKGSDFFRLIGLPHVPGNTLGSRLARTLGSLTRHPMRFLRAYFVGSWAERTQILLYMRSLDSSLRFRLGRSARTGFQTGLVSELAEGEAPKAFMPEATELAERMAEKMDGVPMSLATEVLQGIPTTAHILGGACIGKDEASGVIGPDHQVWGNPGLYVVDGSAISANPGVNPSLTITAMAERAMSLLPAKDVTGMRHSTDPPEPA